MLPRILLNPVYRFLQSIDRCISYDVRALQRAHENGITDRLLWCLNADGKPVPNILFSISDLKREVRNLVGEGFPIGVEFKTEGYAQNYEGGVTQADYGLSINFNDPSQTDLATRKWSATYFMQSKVAKIPVKSNDWDGRATFTRTKGQLDAIDRLRSLAGSRGLLYHLYCPPGAIQLAGDSELSKSIKAMGTEDGVSSVYWHSGFWLSQTFPSNINALFAQVSHPTPWSLFILSHFFDVKASDGSLMEPERLYEGEKNKQAQFREDLFNRKRAAVENAFQVQTVNGQTKELVESYFAAQPHRTVSMDITFPTYDYDKSMQLGATSEHEDIPDIEREADAENDEKEFDDNTGGLSIGMTPGGTG